MFAFSDPVPSSSLPARESPSAFSAAFVGRHNASGRLRLVTAAGAGGTGRRLGVVGVVMVGMMMYAGGAAVQKLLRRLPGLPLLLVMLRSLRRAWGGNGVVVVSFLLLLGVSTAV